MVKVEVLIRKEERWKLVVRAYLEHPAHAQKHNFKGSFYFMVCGDAAEPPQNSPPFFHHRRYDGGVNGLRKIDKKKVKEE